MPSNMKHLSFTRLSDWKAWISLLEPNSAISMIDDKKQTTSKAALLLCIPSTFIFDSKLQEYTLLSSDRHGNVTCKVFPSHSYILYMRSHLLELSDARMYYKPPYVCHVQYEGGSSIQQQRVASNKSFLAICETMRAKETCSRLPTRHSDASIQPPLVLREYIQPTDGKLYRACYCRYTISLIFCS